MSSTTEVKEDYEYFEEPEENYFGKPQDSTSEEEEGNDVAVDEPSNEIHDGKSVSSLSNGHEDKSEELKKLTHEKTAQTSKVTSLSENIQQQQNFVGKTCLVRGKKMDCNETEVQESNTTEKAGNNSTVVLAEGSVQHSKCDSGSYSFTFTIRVDRSLFDFMRALAHYINLTIFAWKST